MSEWLQCPGCGLKHRGRDDGRCPRCGAEVAADGLAAFDGAAGGGPAPAPPGAQADGMPLGWRIGGGLLVLNALVVAAEMATPARDPATAPFAASVPIDLILGGLLLAGRPGVRVFVLVRVILGAAVFGALRLAEGDHVTLALQLAFSTALVLLLAGRPRRPRVVVACTAAGAYFALALAGLLVLTGTAPGVATALWRVQGELGAPVDGAEVAGVHHRYRLTLASPQSWHHRAAARVQRDNPLADLWLVRPDVDASVMVIVEELPGAGAVQVDALVEAVLDNGRSAASRFAPGPARMLAGSPPGRLVQATATIDGIDLLFWYGIYAEGERAVQVIGFAPAEQAGAVGEELRAIVSSFAWR